MRWVEAPDGTALPISSCAGASTWTGQAIGGWTRNETGAGLAAISVMVMLAPSQGDPVWRNTILQNTFGDQQGVIEDHQSAGGGVAPIPAVKHVASYYFKAAISADRTRATVQWMVSRSDGGLLTATSTLAWAGGDWKLQIPAAPLALATAPPGKDWQAFIAPHN